ncbi:MAG: hypothetical protein IK105_09145 [Thermoguttaceae bacterium]|nr:hypothetical protein [Thermoguttaceae bacterium]MBR5416085.1 hypothetical protein [Thermoguttaceae bacterium]MBR6480967.1 hypothetical protein [Thermoguttaceae bacterium]
MTILTGISTSARRKACSKITAGINSLFYRPGSPVEPKMPEGISQKAENFSPADGSAVLGLPEGRSDFMHKAADSLEEERLFYIRFPRLACLPGQNQI